MATTKTATKESPAVHVARQEVERLKRVHDLRKAKVTDTQHKLTAARARLKELTARAQGREGFACEGFAGGEEGGGVVMGVMSGVMWDVWTVIVCVVAWAIWTLACARAQRPSRKDRRR